MKRLAWLIAIFVTVAFAVPAGAARLKDIADFGGVRSNQLVGYGLVVGLNKTGDGNSMRSTTNSILNMLTSMGVKVEQRDIKSGNVAAVMVTATLPPFARQGQKLDVTVSSVGDAKSLQGGTLIMCPLKGPDSRTYAVAQGAVSIGGYAAGGGGDSVTKNHPTAGIVPSGAMVEHEVTVMLNALKEVTIAMSSQDFSTAMRAANAINQDLGGEGARAVDSRTIRLTVPEAYKGNIPALMARIENVDVQPETIAKVIVNERTGTVVMGSNVRLSPVAIAHGNIHVKIATTPVISQPGALSGGQTVVTQNTNVVVTEDGGQMFMLPIQTSIGDLVTALNAVGVSARDLVAILQAIKAAGALQAQLEII
ncbi:MAG: flagellar basal body P-ring protein FlgI [Candidatus Lernaella stagnicola]|nr:flagellar basal body P-ring protein FlgI [Candidatus Lernaella stagnicola]